MSAPASCAQCVSSALAKRLADLKILWQAHCEGAEDQVDPELGRLSEYGLSLDYVAPGTLEDQREGYVCYLLSWGGPSDEFRFFINPDLSCHRVEYWFVDWFDGASITLSNQDETLLLEIWDWLSEGLDRADGITRGASS